MDKMEMSMTIEVNFRIILFDYDLCKATAESLKKQFFEEQINIVESKIIWRSNEVSLRCIR